MLNENLPLFMASFVIAFLACGFLGTPLWIWSDSRMSTYAVGLVDGGLGRELIRLRHVAVQKTIRIEGNWEDHQ